MKKRELAAEISRRLEAKTGKPVAASAVQEVLDTYHTIVGELLLLGEDHKMGSLGKLVPTHIAGQNGYWTGHEAEGTRRYIPARRAHMTVRFRLSPTMKEEFKNMSTREDEGMDKYAVSTNAQDEDGQKLAMERPRFCPICRQPVEERDGQLFCPNHGTAPFER